MFKCTKCGIDKPLKDFKTSKSRRGHTTKCRACYGEYQQNYARGDKGRELKYRHRYGLSLEDVKNLYFEQEGKCKICGVSKPPQGYHGLHVDHDHITGKVRGLLCNECNMMLGLVKDNSAILISAINYLKQNETREL